MQQKPDNDKDGPDRARLVVAVITLVVRILTWSDDHSWWWWHR